MADPLQGNRKNYPQSTLNRWNFRDWHIGSDQGGAHTNAITSENFFVAAGPARLSQIGSSFAQKVVPIGMVESVSVGQQKMVQPVREIGSRRSYHVSSFASGNMSLSRAMFSQASLLKMLTIANDDISDIDNPAGPESPLAYDGDSQATTNDASMWINLQSEVFDRPFGLLLYILDQRNVPYGAMYAEDVFINSHNFALMAQGVTVSEQVSMVFDRILPVGVGTGG